MAVAEEKKPALRKRGVGEIKRLRNAARSVLPVLAELERVETADRFGKLVIGPEESIPETLDELESLLWLAREDHPDQELEIVVIARSGQRGESTNEDIQRGSEG